MCKISNDIAWKEKTWKKKVTMETVTTGASVAETARLG